MGFSVVLSYPIISLFRVNWSVGSVGLLEGALAAFNNPTLPTLQEGVALKAFLLSFGSFLSSSRKEERKERMPQDLYFSHK